MARSPRGFVLLLLGLVLGWAATVVPAEVRAGEPYRSPLEDWTHVTSSFAEYRGDHLHNGIDFSTDGRIGRPVLAIDTGTVVRVFYDPDRYGKTVVLQHGDGRRSWYSHLDRVSERFIEDSDGRLLPGDDRAVTRTVRVDRGETIGRSGRSGRGPEHLHLVLEDSDGTFLNPVGHFEPALEYDPEPRLEELRVYPLTARGWIEGKARDVRFEDTPNEPVRVWGKLGLDLTLWNRHENGSTRSLPARVTVRRDGSVVRRLDFSSLTPFQQDTGVVTLFDQLRSNLTPTQFTLHATPKESNRWTGLEFTEEGDTGRVSVEIATRRGTSRTYEFTYNVVPPPERVEWGPERRATNSTGEVESVRQATPNFRLASLESSQFAERQYSPPSYETVREPSLNLETEWNTNRVRVDLRVENRWDGWPRVRIEGDRFDTDLELLQVEPGHFVGWWAPGWSRDGWYEFTASLPSEGTVSEDTADVYVQSLRRKKPGSVLSLDGRYSLFTSGSGLNANSFVTMEPAERKPLRDELSYVEAPRRVRPGWIESTERLELTVDLSEFDSTDRIGLYQWKPVPGEWRVVSHEEGLTSTSRTARLSNPGTLALIRDESPPEVGTPKYVEDRETLLVPVTEEGSGLESATVTTGNSPGTVPSDWDPGRDLLIVPGVTEEEAAGTFDLTLVDRAGNRTTWTGEGLR